jgi:hypothetical protein
LLHVDDGFGTGGSDQRRLEVGVDVGLLAVLAVEHLGCEATGEGAGVHQRAPVASPAWAASDLTSR